VRPRAAAALVAALAFLLAACSGVPRSSAPHIERSIGAEASAPAGPVKPPAGADPRLIVEQFLANNASADVRHTNARQFLTPDAQKRWQDTTATVVDETRLSIPDPLTGDVVVTARRIGSVAADGSYTPSLRDPASANADEVRFTFGMSRAENQWRIDQLPNGLIITQADFTSSYSQVPVYFFDSTEQVLVPDMRYTATTGQSLATFLLGQLIAGPRGELAAMVNEVPDQPVTGNPTVTVGEVTDVDLGSVRELPGVAQARLAAQLAYTLSSRPTDKVGQRTGIGELRLMEAGTPVLVPGRDVTFAVGDFPDYLPASQLNGDMLFLRGGVIYSSDRGKPLSDPAAGGPANLTSATRAHGQQGGLAAVGATAAGDQLYIGADVPSLAPVASVAAPRLTRPSWAALWNEVWISDGARMWRVTDRALAAEVPMAARAGQQQGDIVSARLSRDGSRIAVIYDIPGSGRSIWVGTIVRGAGDARVEQLTQITGDLGRLDDLAWSDEGTLLAVGQQSSGDYGVWTVKIDGSFLATRPTIGLPAPADGRPLTVTATPRYFARIAVAESLWELGGAAWTPAMSDPFGPSVATPGSSPAYED